MKIQNFKYQIFSQLNSANELRWTNSNELSILMKIDLINLMNCQKIDRIKVFKNRFYRKSWNLFLCIIISLYPNFLKWNFKYSQCLISQFFNFVSKLQIGGFYTFYKILFKSKFITLKLINNLEVKKTWLKILKYSVYIETL